MACDGHKHSSGLAGRFFCKEPQEAWLLVVPGEQRAVGNMGLAQWRIRLDRSAGRTGYHEHSRHAEE